MLFSKRKPDTDETDGSVAAETAGGGGVAVAVATTTKKRKPQELLSSVVKESTVSAAVQLMKDNEAFALPSGKSWIVLALPVEGINGLSMKQKNDEAKGSLIELITADEITTVATADMLEGETFGIITSAKTLDRMDEFSLLKTAKYLWVVMTQTPDGALSADAVSEGNYEQAVAVSKGHTTLAELLPEVWAWGGGNAAAPRQEPTAVAAPAAGPSLDEPLIGDSDDLFVEGNPFEGNPFEDAATDEGEIDYNELSDGLEGIENEFLEEGDLGSEADLLLSSSEPDEVASLVNDTPIQQTPVEDTRVFGEAEVRATIARRFLSSDLTLEVDLETFETNFAANSSAISFPVEEGETDWLGRQVNQLVHLANTELELLHSSNENSLREMYVSLMSQHIEKVIEDVSTDRPDTYYHRLLNAAKDDKASREKSGPVEVSAQRKELNARYEAEAAARGRQASEQAILRFREQNRPRHERELADIGLTNDRASEALYDGAQKIILDTRSKDANHRLDMGKTKILNVLMDRQQEHREAEAALVKSWSAEMTKLIDEHRKDDIARSDALIENLSRENQVEALRVEHATRVAEMRQEQQAQVRLLTADMQRVQSEAVAQLKARQEEWDHTLAAEKGKTESANRRVEELLGEFGRVSESVKGEYEVKIKNLEEDNERTAKFHTMTSRAMIPMIIVMGLAALVFGVIIGIWVSGARAQPAAAAVGVLFGAPDFVPML